MPSLDVALALLILMGVALALPAGMRSDLLFSGLIGLVLQILSTSLADSFDGEEEAVGRMAIKSGFATLVYLELLDASFSLDGTIGAFAISTDLALILTGLSLGALFIRSLTVMLSREKALDQLIDLSGARRPLRHWRPGIADALWSGDRPLGLARAGMAQRFARCGAVVTGAGRFHATQACPGLSRDLQKSPCWKARG